MLAVLWQSAALSMAIGIVAWLLRRGTPAVRYWLWQIVALKMLVAPVWTLAVPLTWLPDGLTATPAPDMASAPIEQLKAQTASITDTARPAEVAAAIEPADDDVLSAAARDQRPAAQRAGGSMKRRQIASPAQLTWRGGLMLAWAGIVAAQCGVLAVQRLRLARLLRAAAPADAESTALVARSAARLGITRLPRVLVSPAECSPFVCGLGRSTIVLPQSLSKLLSPQEIEPVIIHELAHIKRHDLLWGWVPQIARRIYFFNPVAHWVAFRVRLEAELACDGWAMQTTGQGAGAYADLLVRVVSRLSEPAMLRTGSAASAALDGKSSLLSKEGS